MATVKRSKVLSSGAGFYDHRVYKLYMGCAGRCEKCGQELMNGAPVHIQTRKGKAAFNGEKKVDIEYYHLMCK